MNIKEKFLSLTTRTYPHGTEQDLFHLLPQNLELDDFGNLFIQVGESPSTMFACHLDTATSARTDIKHKFEGNLIKTDGSSILGADDKAGVVILLNMIENNIPGLYYFFLGEEVGCQGSKKVAQLHKEKPLENIKKVISFDRRGTTSIITHQCSSRCCSDNFGNTLASELNKSGLDVDGYDDVVFDYKNDPTGLYTDSAQFTKIYPECTNISVGYRNEHTFDEFQDIRHLEKLAQTVLKVDWENLPVERDPSKVEYTYSDYGNWGDWDDYSSYKPTYTGGTTTFRSAFATKGYDENLWFEDDEHDNYISCVTCNTHTRKVSKVDLSKSRINFETDLIGQLLMTLDVNYENIKWDGLKLTVKYKLVNGGHVTECSREDLVEFIPELDFWKKLSQEEDDQKYTKKTFNKFFD